MVWGTKGCMGELVWGGHSCPPRLKLVLILIWVLMVPLNQHALES
jgi:hypothetical protein